MKTEVFIAFTDATSMSLLKATLEAWDIEDYEPIAIHVTEAKHDLLRQVASEGLAKGDYIIAELASKPGKAGTHKGSGWRMVVKGSNPSLKVKEHCVN